MLDFDINVIYRIPALLIALTVHEYAHAAVADSLGDPTPRYMGRLTMNPLAHLDPIGTLMLLVAGFGWAKPVQINSRYFRNVPKSLMAVAFAGPGANFFLAFLATFLLGALNFAGFLSVGVYSFLYWVQLYNVWFGLFNLIPLPPLDGSKILMGALPGRYAWQLARLGDYSNIILLAIVFTGLAGKLLSPLAQTLLLAMRVFVGLIF
ncbi:MAG: site-2 protease family protein [Acidaminococcales bacterium]|jgi:Zn-dependent protease|nr:site-2 protease family protein [Acidaminococcales bacterium]